MGNEDFTEDTNVSRLMMTLFSGSTPDWFVYHLFRGTRSKDEGVPGLSVFTADTRTPHSAGRSNSTMGWESKYKLLDAKATTFMSIARWAAPSLLNNWVTPSTRPETEDESIDSSRKWPAAKRPWCCSRRWLTIFHVLQTSKSCDAI